MASGDGPRVFLSAGEASGDQYGAQIIAELRRRTPGMSFAGLGGAAMQAAGQQRVVRAEDVAHMGITEVLRHAPRVFREYRRLVASIRRQRPDVAVLIDFPDVNFRLAKHLKALGVPVVWFVSPQLWAWKRGRLRWVQQRVDRMLVIFPFEEAFFRSRGVQARFVGHPLTSPPPPAHLPRATREEYAARFGLDPGREWIALLPGSRISEIRNNLRAMVDGGTRLGYYPHGKQPELLIPLAATLPDERAEVLARTVAGWLADVAQPPAVRFVRDAQAALLYSRAAAVASGTATVQALVAGNPFVVVYRVSRVTFAVARRLVCYPPEIPAALDAAGNLPVAMPNLIAGRRIVPELLNERFTADTVAAALRPLLDDGPDRATMMADLAEARGLLGKGDPIGAVCDEVLGLLPHPA